jgi:hypothetical protein
LQHTICNIICDKWTASDTIKQTIIEEEKFSKHGEKAICDSQKKRYCLYVDQVRPPFHKFRGMIEEEFAQVWGKIDDRQLFTPSRLESFQWRGYHGKFYAQKDLLRFGYTSDSKCNYCEVSVQTFHHLFVKCPRSQLLFRNFERQYKLDVGLSDCEKLIGVDVRIARDKLSLKRLGILRKGVYHCNHDCRVPKWDEVLTAIDRLYVIEY